MPLQVVFHARVPGTGDKLQLQGLCAYDAAVHCASMTSWPTAQQACDSKAPRKGGLVQQLVQRVCSKLDLALGTARA